MKPHNANLLNAATLIVMGLWGYLSSAAPSPTALIPVGAGLILLLLTSGIKKENKVVAHIAVLLTFLLILAMVMPFKGSLERGNTLGMVRTGVMIITGILAMVAFMKSFRAARKAREAAQ